MTRVLPSAVIGLVLLTVLSACGGDAPASAPAAPADPVELPQASGFVDVPVTRPAKPQPVDARNLPAKARVIGQMPGLTAEEKLCATYAVRTTLDGDPSIEKDNAKVAGVLGNAVVACTAPANLAKLIAGGVGGENGALPDDKRQCLEQQVTGDTKGTARFLSALLTLDVPTVTAAGKVYNDTCHIDITAG